jgi:hypothetical protein
MRKSILLIAALASSIAFAGTTPSPLPATSTTPVAADTSSSKECDTIANACLSAGYVSTSANKRFWEDCMRALLVNQTVDGVNVASSDITACRDFKIGKLQTELQDLQNAKTSGSAPATTPTAVAPVTVR